MGEEITTRGGHLLGLFLERPRARRSRASRWSIEAVHDQGGIAIPAHPARPVPAVARRASCSGASSTDDDPAVHPDAIETFNPTAIGRYRPRRASSRFAAEHGLRPRRQQRRPRRSRRSAPAGRRSRGGPRTTCAGRSSPARRRHHGGVPRLASGSSGCSAASCASTAADARAERRRPDPAATAPVATTAIPAAPGGRRGSIRARARAGRVKIGLVSPYVYPLPGGVTQHVRYLYENLRLRGHDVRILTSSHGLQRASEGDVIRLGKGFSMPANGSVGTVTVSPRFVSQVRDAAGARAVRRPPLPRAVRAVPVARAPARVAERQHRARSTRTAAGRRPTSSAAGRWAATPSASTAGSRCRRPRATSSTATSRATTRCIPNGVDIDRFRRAVPLSRWQDGTREHPVRRAVRAPQGRARPAQGVPDPAQDGPRVAGCCSSAAARRSARRGATSPPAGCGGVEFLGRVSDDGARPAVPDRGRLRLAGDRARVVRDRAARGDGRRRADRRLATSTATRASSGAAARRCSCRRGTRRSSPTAIERLLGDRELAAAMSARRACAAPRSSAGRG